MQRKNYKMPPIKYIVETYSKKACNMTATAAALDVSRSALMRWYRTTPRLKEEMDNAKESLLDIAESKLFQAISEGNVTATIFFLKCQGKQRGYIEKQQTEVSVNPFQELMKSLPNEPEQLRSSGADEIKLLSEKVEE